MKALGLPVGKGLGLLGTGRKVEHCERAVGEECGPKGGRCMHSLVDRARAFGFYSEATEEDSDEILNLFLFLFFLNKKSSQNDCFYKQWLFINNGLWWGGGETASK